MLSAHGDARAAPAARGPRPETAGQPEPAAPPLAAAAPLLAAGPGEVEARGAAEARQLEMEGTLDERATDAGRWAIERGGPSVRRRPGRRPSR